MLFDEYKRWNNHSDLWLCPLDYAYNSAGSSWSTQAELQESLLIICLLSRTNIIAFNEI